MPAQPDKILIIEDHEDTGDAMESFLLGAGYQVLLARSADEALHLFDESINIILSDISLPGSSGWELLQQLTARKNVPAIAISGYGMAQDRERSDAAGFAMHLLKPISGDDLIQQIEKVLKSGSMKS